MRHNNTITCYRYFWYAVMVGKDAYTGCRVIRHRRATSEQWQHRRGEQLTSLAEPFSCTATSTTRNNRRDRPALTMIVWWRDTTLRLSYICVPLYLQGSVYSQPDLSSHDRFPSSLGVTPRRRPSTAHDAKFVMLRVGRCPPVRPWTAVKPAPLPRRPDGLCRMPMYGSCASRLYT